MTGVGGQDGSLLAELLLTEGYDVAGIVRRASSACATNLAAVLDEIELLEADLLDRDSLVGALEHVKPDEVYNLASP